MIHVDETGSSAAEPPSSGATSRSLLERVKADDGAAWETLVGLYGPFVYRWVRRWDLPSTRPPTCFRTFFGRWPSTSPDSAKRMRAIHFAAGCTASPITKCATISESSVASRAARRGTEAQLRLARLARDRLPAEGEESGGEPERLGRLRGPSS